MPKSNKVFNHEQQIKIRQIAKEGSEVLTEVQNLQESLADTIKSISLELDVPVSVLKAAVRIHHKGTRDKHDETTDLINILLETINNSKNTDEKLY